MSCGTETYRAPEIEFKEDDDSYYSQPSDIFSMGVLLFIMYTMRPPFYQCSDKDNYYKLIVNNYTGLFWKTYGEFIGQDESLFFPEEF